MAYQPIENYGIIGNMRTAALVGLNGSIDWYCFPHFDSPSVFAAILDDDKGGRFEIAAAQEGVSTRQLYWPETNVLITRFYSANGVGEIEDFMPVGLPRASPWHHQLIRRVRVTQGSLEFRVRCYPAFDYARAPHKTIITKRGASFHSADLSLGLATGARVFLYEKGYLHAKTISIDSEICSIGSANIGIRSFSINYELNAVLYSKQLAKELEEDFMRDLAHCTEFDLAAYQKRNAALRFRDSLARLLSPLL